MSNYKPKESDEFKGWYEIPGYCKYYANREGEILTKKTGNSTKGTMSGRYLRVAAYKDGDKEHSLVYSHELICRAFYGPPKDNHVVLHKNDNRNDTRASNLKWGTQSDNVKQAWDNGNRVSNESIPPSFKW